VCAQDVLDSKTDAPGANDDGSGTAAVMELVRVMSRYEFDSTLVFLTVAGEEQGLLGSTHWAETAKQKNWNIAGMITNDIIGSSHAEDGHLDDKHVRLFAGELPARGEMTPGLKSLLDVGGENDSQTRQLGRYIKEMGEKYVPNMNVTLILRRDRYGRGGDHSPFLDQGFPAVRFTEPNEDYKHQHQTVRTEEGVQYGDTLEFVDYKFIANVARVNAAALASLALAPATPKNVHLELAKQENNTTLSWDANNEADIAGYQIVWRETTATFWQQKLPVGNVTTYTIKGLSKDNYIFGVQALDRDGNLSLVVYPQLYRPK
jgi:Zn-dependent M28 family amino/carboxypeptidase